MTVRGLGETHVGLCSLVVSLGFLTACSALNSWEIPNGNLLDYVTPDLTADWLRFKKEYNRTYSNSYEELKRRFIWEDAHRFVEEHNKKFEQGEYTYTVGENDFADLADDEVRKYYLSGLIVPDDVEEGSSPNTEEMYVDDLQLPSTKNWVTAGKVTAVRNQGSCGSCWAFSAIGAMESAYMIKHGREVDMSEQQLVDCAYGSYWGNYGCRGGWMQKAYNYIKYYGGINREQCYRYAGRRQRCLARKSCNAASLKSYSQVTMGSETAMKAAIANKGPLAIAANVNNPGFMRYRSGVFNDPRCSKIPTHAMVAVGYGSERYGSYWLVKNSWGTRWGDNGYIKMARDQNNQCAIASYAYYPEVN